MDRGLAPAKINLALHVTGLRADGYHLLDSLVVFAGIGDQITATAADHLGLTVTGPFAQGVPTDDTNLVIRAARALQSARGVRKGAAIRLVKNLPHAAGIGSGSSDAAAALRLLADLWGVPPLTATDAAVQALGADLPVCLAAPRPQRMRGIGERLSPIAPLPPAALVLVNPRVPLPTRDIFARLSERENAPLDPLPAGLDLAGFANWLKRQRNDLQEVAETMAPPVVTALRRLRALPGVAFAAMSGSGATCFGLCRDMGAARAAARAIQIAEQGWWVAPAELLSSTAVAA